MVFFRKLNYYGFYNHRLLFVVCLAFSRSLTNYAIISSIINYFTNYENSLVKSAIMSNLQDSSSSLLVIFMAHSADSCFGRFHTLLFSNTAYIGGLMLLWLFNLHEWNGFVMISLILLAFGTSGTGILQDVLENLVNDIDKSQDKTETRSLARATTWSRIADVCGATSALVWVAPDAIVGVHSSWRRSFLICICTMTVASMIFCKGHKLYHQGELTERPFKVFLRVFHTHIKKLLKCNSSSSYKEDMVVIKSLLRMFPMWLMFLVVALMSATGSTFFLQQFNNLNSKNSSNIAVQIYNVLQDLSCFAIGLICGSYKNERVKIGVGMLCGTVSCIFAWQLEVHRLKKVNYLVDKDENTSISFFWLVPQFCVLGCMEGLTGEGLRKFYKSQLKEEPLKGYGEEYIQLVMGLGKLLNIFLILIFQGRPGWFGDTINDSRLDKFYLLLVYICTTNFIAYCFIAILCYKDLNEENQTEP